MTAVPADPSADTRARIVAAAGELLARFTIAKLTMEDVARASGIARQTVYKHFRNKDELVAELIAQELRTRHTPLMQKFAQDPPSAEHFTEIFMAQLEVGRAFSFIDPVLDPLIAPRMAELIFGVDVVLQTLEEAWAPVLSAYEAAGLLRADRDHRQIVRWITYQQFWLITHPDVLTEDAEALETYVAQYIVAGIVRSAPRG